MVYLFKTDLPYKRIKTDTFLFKILLYVFIIHRIRGIKNHNYRIT